MSPGLGTAQLVDSGTEHLLWLQSGCWPGLQASELTHSWWIQLLITWASSQVAWMSSQHGGWFPPERVIWERWELQVFINSSQKWCANTSALIYGHRDPLWYSEQGTMQGCEYQEWGTTGVFLEARDHHVTIKVFHSLLGMQGIFWRRVYGWRRLGSWLYTK